MLTHERLIEVLDYNKDSGLFTWLIKPSSRVKTGDVAGTKYPSGYVGISIDGVRFYAHRLAWLYTAGSWPDEGLTIDHKNGNKSDNSIQNLRLATVQENIHNSRRCKDTASGFKGAHWYAPYKKWRARINWQGKDLFLGYFETAEAAHEAWKAKAKELHGEFFNAG